MPAFIGLGAGAGLGALKYGLEDKPRYASQKALAAATQRYSPWTHMQAQAPDEPSLLGDITKFGMAGLQQGQGFSKSSQAMDLQKAQTAWLNMNNPAMQKLDTDVAGMPSATNLKFGTKYLGD